MNNFWKNKTGASNLAPHKLRPADQWMARASCKVRRKWWKRMGLEPRRRPQRAFINYGADSFRPLPFGTWDLNITHLSGGQNSQNLMVSPPLLPDSPWNKWKPAIMRDWENGSWGEKINMLYITYCYIRINIYSSYINIRMIIPHFFIYFWHLTKNSSCH